MGTGIDKKKTRAQNQEAEAEERAIKCSVPLILNSSGNKMNKRTKRNVSAGLGIVAVTSLSGGLLWNYYFGGKNVPISKANNVAISKVESPRDRGEKVVRPGVESRIENLTEANRLLMDFPNKIPGAGSVDKYITPGARYCLVHIKSGHVANRYGYSKVNNRIHKDLSSILSDLIEHHGLDEVYSEGIIPSYAEIVNSGNPNYYPKKLAKTSLEKDMQSGFKIIMKSLSELVDEGKLKISAAEIEENYMRAAKTVAHTPSSSSRVVMDDREDALLEIISRQQKSLIVTVYGAGHIWGGKDSFGDRYNGRQKVSYNLKDNISIWNKKHPKQKFSLIEVFPDFLKVFSTNKKAFSN